ncbi:MAG: hypothetical protein U0T73_07650 [Chitinophagales bacterium]
MKKLVLITAVVLSIVNVKAETNPSAAGAGKAMPVIASQKDKWLFKPLVSNEVSLEMERIGDEVMLYLYSQTMKNYDAIVIEKSQNGSLFVPCKTVKVAEHLTQSKTYIGISDEKPLPANSDCYYRIKATTKTGVTKVYDPQVLSSLQYIEPVEFVENQR